VIADLRVPFRDARAADLGFALALGAAAPRPALAALELEAGDVVLELRILGGSHAARVRAAGLDLTETVACDAAGGALPALHEAAAAGRSYRFIAATHRPGATALAVLAARLRELLGPCPRGVVAGFPGHPDALTAAVLEADETGVGWRTWHLYPGAGEVVRTATVLARG
jgi:hypothetical protein